MFVDYSNVSASAGVPRGIKLSASVLKSVALKERDTRRLMVARTTATKAKAEQRTQAWKAQGFETGFRARPRGMPEAALYVDDRLVGAAALAISMQYPGRQTMVLLTGDGGNSGGEESRVGLNAPCFQSSSMCICTASWGVIY